MIASIDLSARSRTAAGQGPALSRVRGRACGARPRLRRRFAPFRPARRPASSSRRGRLPPTAPRPRPWRRRRPRRGPRPRPESARVGPAGSTRCRGRAGRRAGRAGCDAGGAAAGAVSSSGASSAAAGRGASSGAAAATSRNTSSAPSSASGRRGLRFRGGTGASTSTGVIAPMSRMYGQSKSMSGY